jgi:EAL domain-containing protein (putative c-di-GMP-specific phosphodiesterase class I)
VLAFFFLYLKSFFALELLYITPIAFILSTKEPLLQPILDKRIQTVVCAYLLKFITSKITFCLVCILSAIFTSSLMAAPPVNYHNETTEKELNVTFEYFEDIDKELTLDSTTKLPDFRWSKVEEGRASFGFSPSQFWLRLNINNTVEKTRNFVLEIKYPLLDDVTFYLMQNDKVIHTSRTGDSKPFYPREVDHPSMLVRFQLKEKEEISIYAKVNTKGSMILPVRLWQENEFFESAAQEQKFHFFFYGFLTVIMLINLAIFFTLREKLYLYYSLATSGYLLFFATSRGYAHQLFFSEHPALNTQLFVSSMPILALFSLLFAREFLQTKQHSPKMDMAIRGMIYFEYFNLLAAAFLDYNTAVKISAVSALVLFAVLSFAGPVTWHAKKRAGAFFTIAWLPLTIGFAATSGRTSGLLADNFFTEYSMQLGSGLEALILTLALADRLYRERDEKIKAQAANIQKEQQRLAIQNQLSEAMMRDPITNLANRNRFEWLADDMFELHKNQGFVICVARVTRINEITRTLGLSSVEQILRTIAGRMNPAINKMPGVITAQNSQGARDSTFQLSGDTFGVLIRKKEFEKNIVQYKSFIQKLLLPIEMDLLSIELDPLVGCATYPEDGLDAAQLIRNALVAMESSRNAGEQIVFYDNALDIYNENRLTLMSDLKEALRNDEPELYYQPKLNLKSNRIVGLEALIRWQHPQLGFVPPADFVPLAEQTGVVKEMTSWVIERAAKDLTWLRSNGYSGSVSINISAKDLLSENLLNNLENMLNTYAIEPSSILLELTETAAMDEPEAGLRALHHLASLGLRISIDDFGAGYSSLSYLKQIPASEIKLDRSLIIGITNSESSLLIVKASIDIAHGLGYSVVAEGVEDEATKELMKTLGCDELQGFLLSKPKQLRDIMEWLTLQQTPQQ